jgi:hypothetical protein
MNSTRVKIPFEGETVDAEDIAFELLETALASLRTSDGATITMKHDIQKVYRLCDKKKDDGTPIYVMVGRTAITINHPNLAEKKG